MDPWPVSQVPESPKAVDPMSNDLAEKFFIALADFIVGARPNLKSGERCLEFTTETLKTLTCRLHTELSKKKGLTSFFKKDMTAKVMETTRDGVKVSSHVVITGPSSGGTGVEDDTTMDPSRLNMAEFTSLTKLEIRRVAIINLKGVRDVAEIVCHQCSMGDIFQLLEQVRTVRLFHCNMQWDAIRHVSASLRVLQVQSCINSARLTFPVSEDKAGGWNCLTDLDVSGNGFESLDASCSFLLNVTRVNLSFNELRDISPLAVCANIRYAVLNNNHFTSLTALCQSLPHVTELDVAHNDIGTFAGLEYAPQIQSLNIEANKLLTFWWADEIQEKCPFLHSISFHENPVMEKVRSDEMTFLERAVFGNRKSMTVEGVQYGALPEQTLADMRHKYAKLWLPPYSEVKEKKPTPPASPTTTTTTVRRTIVVRDAPIVEELDARERTLSKLGDSLSRSPEGSHIRDIEKDKNLYGDDWLNVTSNTTTASAEVNPAVTTTKKVVKTKVIVKKIVRKVVPKKADPGSLTNFSLNSENYEREVTESVTETTTPPSSLSERTGSLIEQPIPEPVVAPQRSVSPQSPLKPSDNKKADVPVNKKADVIPVILPEVKSVPDLSSPINLASTLPAHQESLSPIRRSGSPILAQHRATTWRQLTAAEVEATAWVGVKNAMHLLPHHAFPKSGPMGCRVFPMVAGPLWEEEDAAKGAVEVWLLDPKRETTSLPTDVQRYKDRWLLKITESTTTVPGVKYISVRQRKLNSSEIDATAEESKPSSFDKTPFTYVYCPQGDLSSDNDGSEYRLGLPEPTVTVRNADIVKNVAETPKGILSNNRFSMQTDWEKDGPMDGQVFLTPTNADGVLASVGLVNRQRTLCGFVVSGPEIASALVAFLQARMPQVLDQTNHAPSSPKSARGVPTSMAASLKDNNATNSVASVPQVASLENTLTTVAPISLAAQRVGSYPPVTPDEVEMHLKLSVFGKPVDPEILAAFRVAIPVRQGEVRSPKNASETLVSATYVNFLFSSDKENDERCGLIIVSNESIYFILDYNMSYPALNLTQYLVPFTNHPRGALTGVTVGHNFQYIRITFGGVDSQTYLLLTRDVAVSTGILKCLQGVITTDGLDVKITNLESPFASRPLDSSGDVVGYFCMFSATIGPSHAPQRNILDPRAALNKASATLSKMVPKGLKKGFVPTTDFPQTVYPVRHSARELFPVTLVVTNTLIYLVQENYASWPDDEKSASRYVVLRKAEIQDLEHIEIVNERNSVAALAIALSFVGYESDIDRWVLLSQHGTNIASIVHALSKVSFEKLRIQLPRVDMSAADRASLFDMEPDRTEFLISSLVAPFKKAYNLK